MNGSCESCPLDCEFCALNNNMTVECKSCFDGYYLKNESCLQCPIGCSQCAFNNSNVTCSQCMNKYVKSYDQTCVLCDIESCYLCNNQTKPNELNCNICNDGYFVTNAGSCESCFSNCRDCSDFTGKCNSCESDYYITITGLCRNCQSDIKFCAYCSNHFSPPYCEDCYAGYFSLKKHNPPICRPCDLVNCSECDINEDETDLICIACIDLYEVDSNNQSCILKECNERTGISKCTDCEVDVCTQCQDGYYLDYYNDCISCSNHYLGYRCIACDLKGEHCLKCIDDNCNFMKILMGETFILLVILFIWLLE